MVHRSDNTTGGASHQVEVSPEEKKQRVQPPEVNTSSGGKKATEKPSVAKAAKSDPAPAASGLKKQKGQAKKGKAEGIAKY